MKIVLKDNSAEVAIKSVNPPQIFKKTKRSRDYSHVTTLTIEGEKVKIYVDRTWGNRFYFNYNNIWYSGDVFDVDKLGNITSQAKAEIKRGNPVDKKEKE